MQTLIICCDGSWNDAEDRTHIYRIAEAARRLDADRVKVFYDQGVGTSFGEICFGGGMGFGLSKNVREAYRWLVAHYRQGDRIFMFGFSRGAFTVRSLSGLLQFAGLVRPSDESLIDLIWQAYRTKPKAALDEHSRSDRSPAYKKFQEVKERLHARKPPIRFIGVFDTVGAMGVPINWLQKAVTALWPRLNVQFHDTELSANVEIARQALAIDERRGPFEPALWCVPGDVPTCATQQDCKQVWFAGVHADIGGGYEDKRLAEVPLVWMLSEARHAGLDLFSGFDGDPLLPDCHGRMHDSLSWIYRIIQSPMLSWLTRIFPGDRPITEQQRQADVAGKNDRLLKRIRMLLKLDHPDRPCRVIGEQIHQSAIKRYRQPSENLEILGQSRCLSTNLNAAIAGHGAIENAAGEPLFALGR